MDKVIQEKWIKALLSRSYQSNKQIWLCSKNGTRKERFTSFGVLTDLYLKHKGLSWSYTLASSDFKDPEDAKDLLYAGLSSVKGSSITNESKGWLAPAVMKWAKIKTPQCEIDDIHNVTSHKRRSIYNLGSSLFDLEQSGMSFQQIAKLLPNLKFG